MMQKIKGKQEKSIYYGLGFPIELTDFPMLEIDGEWVPRVNYNKLDDMMAIGVPLKPARLTGHEVRFLRLRLGYSHQEFAGLFESTRQDVIKWEKSGDGITKMKWPTEKDLRLRVLARENLQPSLFRKAHELLNSAIDASDKPEIRQVPKAAVSRAKSRLASDYLAGLSHHC